MGNDNDNKPTGLQFKILFDHATIGIIVSDSSGVIIDLNRFAEEQFGYAKDELIDQKIEILIPENLRTKHLKYRQDFYAGPHNRSMGAGRDLLARKKDGSTFSVEISLSYYTMAGQLYVLAFVIDISIRKKNEELMLLQTSELEKKTEEIRLLNTELEKKVEDRTKMLKETLAELERSKKELSETLKIEKELGDLKSRFVTMASHEFRTPLSTILSSAVLTGKYIHEHEQEKREKHIRRIRDAVGNMKNILEDFLSLGKLEEGLIKAKPEIISSEEFIFEMNHMIEDLQQISKPGQSIIFTHQIDHSVNLDINLFKNIFANLLTNAIKFSPEGAEIVNTIYLSEETLILSVSDHGIGISEEDQTHLFERFFRAKNAINVQGTGLGLHIIGKYLELMNGTLELNSVLNEGTEVIIHLPQDH